MISAKPVTLIGGSTKEIHEPVGAVNGGYSALKVTSMVAGKKVDVLLRMPWAQHEELSRICGAAPEAFIATVAAMINERAAMSDEAVRNTLGDQEFDAYGEPVL